MSEMDELDKKAQEGLNKYKADGGSDFKFDLDHRIDDLLGGTASVDEEDKQTPSSKKNYTIPLVIISGILLLLLAFWGYNDAKTENAPPDPQALFAQYFEPMDDISSGVSRGETNEKSENRKGMQFYKLGKYKQAAELLLSKQSPQSQFYGALALLNSGDSDGALSYLTSMQKSDTFKKYHDIINWYTALAHLSSGEVTAAKKELQLISKANGFKSAEAKKMLDSL